MQIDPQHRAVDHDVIRCPVPIIELAIDDHWSSAACNGAEQRAEHHEKQDAAVCEAMRAAASCIAVPLIKRDASRARRMPESDWSCVRLVSQCMDAVPACRWRHDKQSKRSENVCFPIHPFTSPRRPTTETAETRAPSKPSAFPS